MSQTQAVIKFATYAAATAAVGYFIIDRFSIHEEEFREKVGIRTEASKRTTEETMKLIKGAAHVEDKK